MDKSTSAVRFDTVIKRYGHDLNALDGFSCTVQSGEVYGLIGPNGAGKTTSIRVLTGLTQATGGSTKVLGGKPGSRAVRQKIGYMPQETALYVDLTVRENLQLFGRLYDIKRAALRQRITELLDFVSLTQQADKVVADLSGGMQHRASLAVALLPKPELLVLDEPTVGVDPELRANFWDRFATMQKDGTTIIITTHYMDEAMRCDRVGLVNHGRLIAEGKPAELIRRAGVHTLEQAFLALAGRKGGES